MPRRCKQSSCTRPIHARGLCQRCYMRLWKNTHPDNVAVSRARERTQRKIKYHSDSTYRQRRRATVRQSHRNRMGLGNGMYQKLVDQQGGRCAICQQGTVRVLFIDHDHATGEVRGLLCRNCNSGIGLLQDSPKVIKQALSYVQTGKTFPNPELLRGEARTAVEAELAKEQEKKNANPN